MYTKCRTLLILVVVLYFITISYTSKHLLKSTAPIFFTKKNQVITDSDSPTDLSHLVFGIMGSEEAWQHRKAYVESWWRPNVTRGYLFLDKAPSPKLLPWPQASPPFRVSDDIKQPVNRSVIQAQRMVHGIMEVLRELDHETNTRWVVMGDDDSIFFVDNIVDVLAKYDHTKYYYLGARSEFIMSNVWFSFNQAFGGGGIMLSYPLAKALARDIENCLKRYVFLSSSDNITRACIADIGANLSPQAGNHQLDFLGDISGLLSSHSLSPLMSLHHFDMVEPIFPLKNRFKSTRHLMTAAKVDQSRMLQQTICYHRQSNWSISISWGYSAQIYERIMPRSHLQAPIETFRPWMRTRGPPYYMFNARKLSRDPCEAPHAFFFESVAKRIESNEIRTSYSRAWPRGLPACSSSGNHSAENIQRIQVFSPATKRTEVSSVSI